MCVYVNSLTSSVYLMALFYSCHTCWQAMGHIKELTDQRSLGLTHCDLYITYNQYIHRLYWRFLYIKSFIYTVFSSHSEQLVKHRCLVKNAKSSKLRKCTIFGKIVAYCYWLRGIFIKSKAILGIEKSVHWAHNTITCILSPMSINNFLHSKFPMNISIHTIYPCLTSFMKVINCVILWLWILYHLS